MSNETKQEHTAEPWHFEKDNFSNFIMDSELNIICQLFNKYETDFPNFKPNAKRIVACVNALEGIKDPEAFVKDAINSFKEPAIELELLKYKTACEAINPDNPMAVAENLEDLFVVAKRLMGYLKYTNLLPESEVEYNDLKTVLTKIQSK